MSNEEESSRTQSSVLETHYSDFPSHLSPQYSKLITPNDGGDGCVPGPIPCVEKSRI